MLDRKLTHVPDVYRKPPCIIGLVQSKHPRDNLDLGINVESKVSFSESPEKLQTAYF